MKKNIKTDNILPKKLSNSVCNKKDKGPKIKKNISDTESVKPVKRTSKTKNDNIDNNSICDNKHTDSGVDNKKQTSKSRTRAKSERPQDAEQKSNSDSKNFGKNRKNSTKTGTGNKSNRADNTKNRVSFATRTKCDNETAVKSTKRAGSKQRTKSANIESNEQVEKIIFTSKSVKRRKRSTVIYNTILPQTLIESEIYPVIGYDDLAEIVVRGEHMQVSVWSIRGKYYIQGLDSEYLVHNFKYPERTK